MSTSQDSRSAILDRIRAASSAGPAEVTATYAALPREYRRHGQLSAHARVALMIERLQEYEAEVTECAPEEIVQAIACVIEASGRRMLVAPSGLPGEWLVPACNWKIDEHLTHDEIEHADGVVTAGTCAIAESGTIVLHHTSNEGRRVLSLLPDWHLCVLRASQVIETLPEYFQLCPEPPALATFISGPSATADIEMTRIKGVHGPRFLNVLIVRDIGNSEARAVSGAKEPQ
jgi:L-lactate dehydrogenase complex protein LldG